MPGWYVRRSEKVVSPVDSAKLKELAAKVLKQWMPTTTFQACRSIDPVQMWH
jgi:hypothetical protein